MPGSPDASVFTKYKGAVAIQSASAQAGNSKSVSRLSSYTPRLSAASNKSEFLPSLTKVIPRSNIGPSPPTGITYSIIPSVTSINEGGSITWTIETTNFGDGTLYYTNSGTTTSADFTDGANSGPITITNNSGTLTKTLTNDVTTEGNQTIVLQLRTGSITGPIVKTAASVTVNDTSAGPSTPPVITYSIIPDVTSADEGTSITWTIETTNFGNGTLYYTNGGTTTSADFTDGANSGSITITNDSGTLTKTLTNDVTTEGSETIVIQLRTESTTGTIVKTATSVTVEDTSIPSPTPVTYSIIPDVTSADEGTSITWTIETTNFGDGTLYYTNSGTTTSADFTDGANSGPITITNNSGTLTKTLTTDVTTEGSETIVIQLRTGSTTGPIVDTAASVTVEDTSTAPPPSPKGWTLANAGIGSLVVEDIAYGDGYLVVTGQGRADSTNQPTGNNIFYTNDLTGYNGLRQISTRLFGRGSGRGVAYGNGYWVAVGEAVNTITNELVDYNICYSTNPSGTWTEIQGPFGTGGIGFDVSYGNGKWVAVGQGVNGGSNIYYTTDPSSAWTAVSGPFGSTMGYSTGYGIAYGNGKWVAVGRGDGGNNIYYTTDPSGTWTAGSTLFSGGYYPAAISYGNGKWVAVGRSNGQTNIYYTTDPSGTWTAVTGPFAPDGATKVTYSNGYWVAVGPGDGQTNIYYTSDPATAWTGISGPYTSQYWKALVYSDTNWITFSNKGSIYYAADPTKVEPV